MEEDDFEKQWRDAFEDAESTPSPLVWNELQTHLHTKKRNKIILRMALVVLLFSFGFLSYYLIPKKESIAIQKNKFNELNSEQKTNQTAETEQSENKTKKFSEKEEINAGKSSENLNSKPYKEEINIKQDKIFKSQTIFVNNEIKLSDNTKNIAIILDTNVTVNQNNESAFTQNKSSVDFKQKNASLDLLPAHQFVFQSNLIEDSLQKNQFKNNYKTASNQKPILPSRWMLGFFLDFSQFNPIYKADYQKYLQEYTKAHELDKLNVNNFFDELQEKNKMGYNLGVRLNVSYQLSRRLALRSGLTYQNNRFIQESNAVFYNPSTNERYAFVNNMLIQNIGNTNLAKTIHNHPDYSASPNTLDLKSLNNGSIYAIKNTFQYLSVPMQLGYTFIFHDKISYTIFGGISTDVFLSHKSNQANLSENSSQDFQNHASFKSIGLSGLLNIALQYQITPKVSLNIEIISRIGLSSYTQPNAMLRFQPRQGGAGWGLQYKF